MANYEFRLGTLGDLIQGRFNSELVSSKKDLLFNFYAGNSPLFIGVFDKSYSEGYLQRIRSSLEQESVEKQEQPSSQVLDVLRDNPWFSQEVSDIPEISISGFNLLSRKDSFPGGLISLIYDPTDFSYEQAQNMIRRSDGLDRIELKDYNCAFQNPVNFEGKKHFSINEYKSVCALVNQQEDSLKFLNSVIGKVNLNRYLFGLSRDESIFLKLLEKRKRYEKKLKEVA